MDGAGDSTTSWNIRKVMFFLKSNYTPAGFSKAEELLKLSEKKNKFEIDTLRGEVVCLREANEELRRLKIATEEERQKSLDLMRGRAREAENRCRKLLEELKKAKEANKEIRFWNMNLELERGRIKAEADMQAMMEKANAEDEAKALRIRCEELVGNVKEMGERNCESERAKANAEAEAEVWSTKFEDLQEKLQAMTERNYQLEEKAEDEGQALRKKCKDLHENLEEMTGRNSELEDEKEKIKKEGKAWMLKFEDLQEQLQAMTEKNRQLECAKAKAEDEGQALRIKCDELRVNVKEITGRNSELEDEKEKAEKEVKALRIRCDALHQEVQEMSDIRRMNSRLKCEKGKVEEEAKALSNECDNLHEKLQEMVDVCKRNCDLESEIARVKEEAEALKIECDDLHQVKIDIERRNGELVFAKDKVHNEANAWRIKCEALHERILRLEEVVKEPQELVQAENKIISLVKVERDVHSGENGRSSSRSFEDTVDDGDDDCCIILNPIPEVNTSHPSAASTKSNQADVQMRTEVLKRKRSEAFNSGEGRTSEIEKLQISDLRFELSSDSCDSSSEDDDKLWAQESEMVADFKRDVEYCLTAICALYRMGKSERRLPLRSSCSNQGFHKSDVSRGSALAEFLIDGDPEMKLRKTAKELQGHDPKSVDECRRIAIRHSKQLFEIYKKYKDRFFPYF